MDAVDWQQRFVLRRFKGFRRILSRFEKLDVMFIGFIHFTLIIETFHNYAIFLPIGCIDKGSRGLSQTPWLVCSGLLPLRPAPAAAQSCLR